MIDPDTYKFLEDAITGESHFSEKEPQKWPAELQNLYNVSKLNEIGGPEADAMREYEFLFTSFGQGPSTYSLRPASLYAINPWGVTLITVTEKCVTPNDIQIEIKDKSSLIRRGLNVGNSTADPGFIGHLTIEVYNHTNKGFWVHPFMGICAIDANMLVRPTTRPYQGKYQNQPKEPVAARDALNTKLVSISSPAKEQSND